MAGACSGCGIDTTDNEVAVYGPREAQWVGNGANSIEATNGLRCDPVSGKLWAPPDAKIAGVCAGAAQKVIVPDDDADNNLLTKLKISINTFANRKTFMVRNIGCGIAGFRSHSGNWWAIKQTSVIRVDGVVPVYGLGVAYTAALENHSGGVMGVGITTPAEMFHFEFTGEHTVELEVTYSIEVLALSVGAANSLTWTPPTVSMMCWSKPL